MPQRASRPRNRYSSRMKRPRCRPSKARSPRKPTGPRSRRCRKRARAIMLFKSDAGRDRQARSRRHHQGARRPGSAWRCLPASAATSRRWSQRRPPPPISSIQSNLAMWSMVQNAWYGLSLGSVLLLAAIGLAITFGVMGVINMAHGEMVMLGRLHHLRGAGGDPHPLSRPVRLFAADRGAARLPRRPARSAC